MNDRVRAGDVCRVVDPGRAAHGYVVLAVRETRAQCSCGRTIFDVDPPLPFETTFRGVLMGTVCCEGLLRPMRPGDGEDEMLRIAGKPNETPADVIREATS